MKRGAFSFGLLFAAAGIFLAGCSDGKIPEPLPTGEPTMIVIDVRTPEEYAEGHLPGALLIPHGEIASRIAQQLPDRKANIKLYCRSGKRAGIALEALSGMGYENVENLGGVQDAAARLNEPIVK